MRQQFTLKELEEISKALSNPQSKPHEYLVRKFGFCTFCGDITEYRTEILGSEGGVVTQCEKCRKNFGGWARGTYPQTQYLTDEDIPQRYKAKVEELHSREMQTRFFKEAAKNTLDSAKREFAGLKVEKRKSGDEINRLQKLLS